MDWEIWTTGTGLPPVEPPFDRSLLEQAEQHTKKPPGKMTRAQIAQNQALLSAARAQAASAKTSERRPGPAPLRW